MSDLLPCPFCGGEMRWSKKSDFFHHDDKTSPCLLREIAFMDVAAWNRRAPDLRVGKLEARNNRMTYLLKGVYRAIKSGRNEPLTVWAEAIAADPAIKDNDNV